MARQARQSRAAPMAFRGPSHAVLHLAACSSSPRSSSCCLPVRVLFRPASLRRAFPPKPTRCRPAACGCMRSSTIARKNGERVRLYSRRAVIMAAVANEIERGDAIVIAGDSFAVDNAGARAQAVAQHPQHSQRWALDGQAILSPDCLSHGPTK